MRDSFIHSFIRSCVCLFLCAVFKCFIFFTLYFFFCAHADPIDRITSVMCECLFVYAFVGLGTYFRSFFQFLSHFMRYSVKVVWKLFQRNQNDVRLLNVVHFIHFFFFFFFLTSISLSCLFFARAQGKYNHIKNEPLIHLIIDIKHIKWELTS